MLTFVLIKIFRWNKSGKFFKLSDIPRTIQNSKLLKGVVKKRFCAIDNDSRPKSQLTFITKSDNN